MRRFANFMVRGMVGLALAAFGFTGAVFILRNRLTGQLDTFPLSLYTRWLKPCEEHLTQLLCTNHLAVELLEKVWEAGLIVAGLLALIIGCRVIGWAALGWSVFLAIATLEGAIALMLQRTDRPIPGLLRPALRYVYQHAYRATAQHECGTDDDDLGYRLAPGECDFKGAEFDTILSVNSRGVRDDEPSLDRPEVVAIGDSFTMGWGVQQRETYAELLETELDRKVLNLGISSYGTARELLLLNQFDLSAVEAIVLQYCSAELGSDLYENQRYLAAPDNFATSVRRRQEQSRLRYHARNRYRPGKYVRVGFRRVYLTGFARLRTAVLSSPHPSVDRHAQTFLAILAAIPIRTERQIPIIVLDPSKQSSFIRGLNELLKRPENETFRQHLVSVDLSNKLDDAAYFQIDDHLNSEGHRRVYSALLPVLREVLEKRLSTSERSETK